MKHQSDILALKYRPTDFKDLIGQEYLVETIQKSIELNKDFKTITIYMSNYKDNITFTFKNACTVFNKLKFHLNT